MQVKKRRKKEERERGGVNRLREGQTIIKSALGVECLIQRELHHHLHDEVHIGLNEH